MVVVEPGPLGPLEFLGLAPLKCRSSHRHAVAIGLLDRPDALGYPDVPGHRIQAAPGDPPGACWDEHSVAGRHRTFLPGILRARRGSAAPAIRPDSTLLVRPMVAAARQAGTRVLNVSAALDGCWLPSAPVRAAGATGRAVALDRWVVSSAGADPRDARPVRLASGEEEYGRLDESASRAGGIFRRPTGSRGSSGRTQPRRKTL